MTGMFRPKTRSNIDLESLFFPVCLLDHVLRCPISDCLITLQVNSRAKLARTQMRRTKYRLDEIYWKKLYNDASSHYSMLPTGTIESKLYKHTSSKGAAAWFGKIGE